VDDVIAREKAAEVKAKQAADAARKAASELAIFTASPRSQCLGPVAKQLKHHSGLGAMV
jgi:hypothetical protein